MTIQYLKKIQYKHTELSVDISKLIYYTELTDMYIYIIVDMSSHWQSYQFIQYISIQNHYFSG